MSVQEQAVHMIKDLSDDNVIFLIDFMQRFMLLKNVRERQAYTADEMEFMQEIERMRVRTKGYFPNE